MTLTEILKFKFLQLNSLTASEENNHLAGVSGSQIGIYNFQEPETMDLQVAVFKL